jgi:hypothetical protein
MRPFGLSGEEVSVYGATGLGSSVGLPAALALAGHGASGPESVGSGWINCHPRLYLVASLVELPPIGQRSFGTALLVAGVALVLIAIKGSVGVSGFLVDELLDLFREVGETGDTGLYQTFLHKVIKLLISSLSIKPI